jgi:hypothetical protein
MEVEKEVWGGFSSPPPSFFFTRFPPEPSISLKKVHSKPVEEEPDFNV